MSLKKLPVRIVIILIVLLMLNILFIYRLILFNEYPMQDRLLNGSHITLNTNESMKFNKEREKSSLDLKKNKTSKFTESLNNELKKLHLQVHHYTTDGEVKEYYNREKRSENLFKKVLDLNKDRDLLSTLFPNPVKNSDRVTDQLRLKLNVTATKHILIWSKDSTLTSKDFKHCNINRCKFTTDKNLANISDAIIFHKPINTIRVPQNFNPDQVRIFYQIESAVYTELVSDETMFYTNWSATYRTDSVLNTPYERFTPYLHVFELPKIPIRDYSKGKHKLVAWYVSNCYTRNGRMNYVLELSKYLDVDIYGQCGKYQCERGHEECEEILKKEYKFYLSFENSNCKDYITEKFFWNALQNDIVPVVMGARPSDYKSVAPPRSYIHVDMFDSPRQLADYLKYLDENDELYNSYFLWKNTGEFINTNFACRLCAMVHLAPQFPMWYNNVNEWWTKSCDHHLNIDGYSTWTERQEEPRNNITYNYKRSKVQSELDPV